MGSALPRLHSRNGGGATSKGREERGRTVGEGRGLIVRGREGGERGDGLLLRETEGREGKREGMEREGEGIPPPRQGE